jgi:L-amino acid N-acyltransferase YncA
MPIEPASFRVRQAMPEDAASLRQILDDIIAVGGTTALEMPLSAEAFNEHFLTGQDCIVCFVVESLDGEPVGFQSLTRNIGLPNGWADIATFTQRTPRSPGAGTALFQATSSFARDLGLVAINATIRADNYAGIPYHEKMGFKTYKVTQAVPLENGLPVDRISKRYDVLNLHKW